MKKFNLSFSVVLFSLVIFSFSNKANGFTFQAIQLQAGVGSEISLVGKDTQKESFLNKTAVKIYLATFSVPQDKLVIFAGYAGVKLTLAPWIWIYPAIGATANYSTSEQFLASLWVGLSFFDNLLSFFLEGDAYIGGEKNYDFYGYYSADWNPTDFMNIGIQAEQANDSAQYGPHLEFSYKVWHGGPQLYLGFSDNEPIWSVRFLSVVTI